MLKYGNGMKIAPLYSGHLENRIYSSPKLAKKYSKNKIVWHLPVRYLAGQPILYHPSRLLQVRSPTVGSIYRSACDDRP